MKRFATMIAALAMLPLAATLTGCSGSSIEGTYFGMAGDTVLVLDVEGVCGYTDDFDEADGVQVEIDDECFWSLSGSNLMLIGVSSSGSVTGTVGVDGALSIPDQNRWLGEIYTSR